METSENVRLWEVLTEIIDLQDKEKLKEFLVNLKSDEFVHAISHLDKDHQTSLLTLLDPENAVEVIEDLPFEQAVQIIEELQTADAAAIINEMSSDDQADFLTDLETEDAEAILIEMAPEDAENVRKLIQYDDDTAGGLMITEFLVFDENKTVNEVTELLREKAEDYKKYNVQYIYVSKEGKFLGVLQIRSLLLSKPDTRLFNIVLKDVHTFQVDEKVDDLIRFFDRYDFYGVPVLDTANVMIGVVLRKDVLEAELEQSNLELLETQGIVGGEEFRTMPVWLRSRRRLSWLSVNIVLNIIAASVIAFYQDTLSSVIALAVFLPIISDMSGCSGNQAVAVSLRELSLGVIKPFEVLRVVWKELSVGLINGVALGILIGAAAWFWKGNLYLGLVVGSALTINTLVAVSIGGAVPLILKKFEVDPALASGPILTTITDMLGFFLVLTIASLMLNYLI